MFYLKQHSRELEYLAIILLPCSFSLEFYWNDFLFMWKLCRLYKIEEDDKSGLKGRRKTNKSKFFFWLKKSLFEENVCLDSKFYLVWTNIINEHLIVKLFYFRHRRLSLFTVTSLSNHTHNPISSLISDINNCTILPSTLFNPKFKMCSTQIEISSPSAFCIQYNFKGEEEQDMFVNNFLTLTHITSQTLPAFHFVVALTLRWWCRTFFSTRFTFKLP